jgi:tetratricopeptide (TPR) repeat protein
MSMKRVDWTYRAHKLGVMFWLVFGRNERALAGLNRMLQLWPDDGYVLSSRSHLHAQAGRREAAIADARALVAAHPTRSAADWFNLAFLLEAEMRLDEAESAFRKAVELDDKLDRAWYGLGLTLIRLGRHDEAVKALERTTKLQPMSPYGWYQLARVHMDRHKPDEARKIIQHLKGFEPKVAAQLERETGLAA